MKYIVISLLLVCAIGLAAAPAHADAGITVSTNSFVSKFPQNLVFQLEATSSAQITQVSLQIQIGSCVTNRFVPTFTPGSQVQATYLWDLNHNYVPPGANGQFWWTIQDSAGNQMDTPKQSFRVDDPAHTWQKLSNDQLALYWYSGGQDFGKALYDRGQQAIGFLQQDMGVTLDQQVQIFIYASHNDLMSSLSAGSQEWTGGEDFPEYSIVLIGIAPSELDWGLGAAAHELTHQVVHRAIANGCSSMGSLSLPPLMDEGLAVYNENPGKPDPQFTIPLRRAIQNDTLMSLRSLTSQFPADPNAANLAYGESWSFVDFLIRKYGKAQMGDFLKAVKEGGALDALMQKVYSKNLDQLEQEWRQDIGAPVHAIPTRNAAAPTPFPTFGLSSGDSPSGSSQATATAPASGASQATATSPAVAVNATPVRATPVPPASAPNAPANPLTNVCGGVFGLIGMGILGMVALRRMNRH